MINDKTKTKTKYTYCQYKIKITLLFLAAKKLALFVEPFILYKTTLRTYITEKNLLRRRK